VARGHGTEGVATHNQSHGGISFGVDFSSFIVDDLLHALLLIIQVASAVFSRSLCRCRFTHEFGLAVANDKPGARPPSCSPRRESHTVISVRQTIHGTVAGTWIHHHLRLLKSHFFAVGC
jgi:hypothetical protein